MTRLEYEQGLLRSTFKPEEVNLSLRRPKAPTLRVDAQGTNTLPSSRSGEDIFRLGGITGYPVRSPPPPGYTSPENLPPSRKTSFINYANPKELWFANEVNFNMVKELFSHWGRSVNFEIPIIVTQIQDVLFKGDTKNFISFVFCKFLTSNQVPFSGIFHSTIDIALFATKIWL